MAGKFRMVWPRVSNASCRLSMSVTDCYEDIHTRCRLRGDQRPTRRKFITSTTDFPSGLRGTSERQLLHKHLPICVCPCSFPWPSKTCQRPISGRPSSAESDEKNIFGWKKQPIYNSGKQKKMETEELQPPTIYSKRGNIFRGGNIQGIEQWWYLIRLLFLVHRQTTYTESEQAQGTLSQLGLTRSHINQKDETPDNS